MIVNICCGFLLACFAFYVYLFIYCFICFVFILSKCICLIEYLVSLNSWGKLFLLLLVGPVFGSYFVM